MSNRIRVIDSQRLSRHVRRTRSRRRRGAMMIYALLSMTAMAGFISLAVDLGRVHLVKTELRACADATALGTMNVCIASGKTAATSYAPTLAAMEPVDASSGISPTVQVTWGTWNSTTNTFTSSSSSSSAVRVTVSRTAANSNALPMMWAKLVGKSSIDLTVQSVAIVVGGQSGSVSVDSVSNAYLSGMPSGTTTIWGDTMTNATPYQVTSVSVTPGTWISLTGASGTSAIVPGTTAYVGADGDASRPLRHGENYDGTPYVPGDENGIADAKMPADALYGVFLTNSAPDSTAAPSGQVDWTTSGIGNKPGYDDIDVKEPFLIGNGTTTSGITQRFLVPPGATRLFLGIWDGVCNSNNDGTITGTLSVRQSAKLVK